MRRQPIIFVARTATVTVLAFLLMAPVLAPGQDRPSASSAITEQELRTVFAMVDAKKTQQREDALKIMAREQMSVKRLQQVYRTRFFGHPRGMSGYDPRDDR